MTDALTFAGVSKRYGKATALDAMSFRVPSGSLCGFVGPNGAGKTTTFSVVGGFCAADEGAVDVLGGGPFDPWRLKGRLGVLPQDADLGDRHSPRELLVHLGRLQGLGARAAAAETARVLASLHLDDRADHRIGTLSHGMRRRVAVATALLGDPALVLLDEPTAGLDPVQARSLRELLVRRPAGQTLVISSHNLDELERICDWIVMVERGRCVRQGPIADVTGRGTLVTWIVAGPAPLDRLSAALIDHAFSQTGDALVHRAPADADLDAASVVVMRLLAEAGVGLREVRRGMSLEQRFLEG